MSQNPNLPPEEKFKLVKEAMNIIEKQFGKGSIMVLGESEGPQQRVEVISTGSLSLDHALGVGGIPKGRIIEIFGPEASGKTTLALHVIANAQKEGGVAAFIDAEHALDPNYAKNIGIDLEKLLISQPDYGEQALEIAETLIRSGAVDVVVIDSVAALIPKAELEGNIGDMQIGLQARLMSQALRKLASVAAKFNTAVIFINQVREKVNTFGFGGTPETTPGGRALKFYSSVRLDVRNIGKIKDKDQVVGHTAKIKVVKNKLAAPFKEVEIDIYYGEGISKEAELLKLGEKLGIIKKSGSWYSYKDIKLGQGKEQARKFLKEKEEIAKEIEEEIRKRLQLQ
ncbi:MAG TPA: recombinase RecA [Desulfurobacteriaceae bacterium]|nr:recombinase RecA [Desulfurobacteriaceae bacterium]